MLAFRRAEAEAVAASIAFRQAEAVAALFVWAGRDFLVDARVEDADCLAADVDGVGDEDIAVDHAADALGDGALAAAGLAVEKHGAAGVHDGADEAAGDGVEDEALEGVIDDGGLDALNAD